MNKPFNLERALAGDPVVTRDGCKVVQITYFPTANPSQQVATQLENGDVALYFSDGSYYTSDEDYRDLFMAPKIVRKWVNLYPHSVHSRVTEGIFHDSEESANADAVAARIGNKAFLIEYEG